jgi:hypothetical protein
MTTETIYHAALATHITGITMMAGTTLMDYVIFKQIWKQYWVDKTKSLAISEALVKLQIVFGSGFLLLIISGVTMMYLTHGVFGEQLWFRIKFALILVIMINGLVFGRRMGVLLRKLLPEEISGIDVSDKTLKVRDNLNVFHITQLTIFLAIFILSVFKFN